MKKFISFCLAGILLLSLTACGAKKDDDAYLTAKMEMRIAYGTDAKNAAIVKLIADAPNDSWQNKYTFKSYSQKSEFLQEAAFGNFDLAICSPEEAALLYNKLAGNIQCIAINYTCDYILLSAQEIQSPQDLKGKTVVMSGQGSAPEYGMHTYLTQAEIAEDVSVQFLKTDEEVFAAAAKADEKTVYVLPEPFASNLQAENKALKAFDFGASFAETCGFQYAVGCIIGKKDFVTQNAAAIQLFLTDYNASKTFMQEHAKANASLCEEHAVLANATSKESVFKRTSFTCLTGQEMRDAGEKSLQMIFQNQPGLIGGQMPADDFWLA